MAVDTYTKSGAKASSPVKLDSKIFGLSVDSHKLIKDSYLAYLSNNRPNIAKAKGRSEVRGGGAKPWRQKGTGRARTGSIRSPLWAGGGVTFGPQGSENYRRGMNQKTKRLALRQALSVSAKDGKLKIIDSFGFTEGKVKQAQTLLNKIKAEGRILLVDDATDHKTRLATRNLPNVKLVSASYLTVYDILNADTAVMSKSALTKLSQWLGGSNG